MKLIALSQLSPAIHRKMLSDYYDSGIPALLEEDHFVAGGYPLALFYKALKLQEPIFNDYDIFTASVSRTLLEQSLAKAKIWISQDTTKALTYRRDPNPTIQLIKNKGSLEQTLLSFDIQNCRIAISIKDSEVYLDSSIPQLIKNNELKLTPIMGHKGLGPTADSKSKFTILKRVSKYCDRYNLQTTDPLDKELILSTLTDPSYMIAYYQGQSYYDSGGDCENTFESLNSLRKQFKLEELSSFSIPLDPSIPKTWDRWRSSIPSGNSNSILIQTPTFVSSSKASQFWEKIKPDDFVVSHPF